MNKLRGVYQVALLLAVTSVACSRDQTQTIPLNRQYLGIIPNITNSRLFISAFGDTAHLYRTSLDTLFSELPMAESNYTRLAESRRASFSDSTGRYRAIFELRQVVKGTGLIEVEHVLLSHFSDNRNTGSQLEILLDRDPQILVSGAFFPELVWGPDTLINAFAAGNPNLGEPVLIFTELGGIRGFMTTDATLFYTP
jgi:hypothetical protein